MEISIRGYGKTANGGYVLINLEANDYGNIITASITNLMGRVDKDFIQSLKDIVEELEEQNRLMEKLD